MEKSILRLASVRIGLACFMTVLPAVAQQRGRPFPFGRMAGPAVGAEGPEFKLRLVGSDKTLSLSDYKGKPVALIFGSFT